VALPATTIPPGTRITIDANSAAGAGHDISITASCAEGLPIVVERSVYFDYTPTPAHPMGVDISEWNGRPDGMSSRLSACLPSSVVLTVCTVLISLSHTHKTGEGERYTSRFYHYAYPDMGRAHASSRS